VGFSFWRGFNFSRKVSFLGFSIQIRYWVPAVIRFWFL
jgi:hypothetical protein